MLSFLDAGILGAIEGLTEFLPVSSTAHLIVGATVLGVPQSIFVKTFEIAIQLGAIVAVFAYFRASLKSYFSLLPKIITAFIPTAMIGYLLYSFIKTSLIGNLTVIGIALVVGGIIMIVFEKNKKITKDSNNAVLEIKNMSNKSAIIIGLTQALAVIPGVSRSASTIIAGLSRGLSREAIVLFTFLLGAPTLLVATLYDLYKTSIHFSGGELPIIFVGFLTAFLFAYLSVGFMINLVRRVGFTPFGYYRIIVGILIFIFLL